MLQYVLKIAITAVTVVAVSEIATRSTFWGALLASLPLTSLLAFVWIYLETGDPRQVADLSRCIFWMVIPSLLFFAMLPWLVRAGIGFWLAMLLSAVTTATAYLAMVRVLLRLGVPL